MKLKFFLIGVLLLFTFNLFAQIDTTTFFNLKLKTDKVQITEKRDNGVLRLKNMGLPETYFFFTEDGIYGADDYGILIYEFKSELSFSEEYHYNRFEIEAKDTQVNLKCVVVVYDYYNDGKYKLFFIYKKKEFIFNCIDLN